MAALAALGIFLGAAAEVRAQEVYVRDRDGDYGLQRAAYFQNGKRGRDDGRGGGYREQSAARPAAPRSGGSGDGGGFRRGQVLPQDQRSRAVDDPGRYHLRTAPNGYGWVGDGRNAYLMQRSTGMVLDSVPGAYDSGPRNGGGSRSSGRGYEGGGGGGRAQDSGGGGSRGREQDGGNGGKRGRR